MGGNSMELDSYKDKGVSSAVHSINGNNNKSPSATQVEVISASERDAQALAKLGKKPVLKVRTYDALAMGNSMGLRESELTK